MDYARGLREEIARRDREVEFLKRGRAWKLDKDSHLIREVMGLLTTKSFTTPALARQLSVEPKTAENLICRVSDLGLAKSSKTNRGHLRVSPFGVDLPSTSEE